MPTEEEHGDIDWPWPMPEPRNEVNEPWARQVDDQDEWPGWREINAADAQTDTFA